MNKLVTLTAGLMMLGNSTGGEQMDVYGEISRNASKLVAEIVDTPLTEAQKLELYTQDCTKKLLLIRKLGVRPLDSDGEIIADCVAFQED